LAEHTLPLAQSPPELASNLVGQLKDAAAKHRLPYDGSSIRKAVDAARGHQARVAGER
jgi:hypothetical protein